MELSPTGSGGFNGFNGFGDCEFPGEKVRAQQRIREQILSKQLEISNLELQMSSLLILPKEDPKNPSKSMQDYQELAAKIGQLQKEIEDLKKQLD